VFFNFQAGEMPENEMQPSGRPQERRELFEIGDTFDPMAPHAET
jgi:hypothetical protein